MPLGEGAGAEVLTALVDGQEVDITANRPLVFGRSDVDGEVLGLDPNDMGISAVAGAIEFVWEVWWVHNRSAKRDLLLDDTLGAPPRHLGCGDRHAVSTAHLTVLVPGAVYTHRLELIAPEDYLQRLRHGSSPTSGTITHDDIGLSSRDREVLTALLAGFLEPFPRYHPHPASYAEAAARLGEPWDANRVRKQIERLRGRLAAKGIYIDGATANYDLAEFLIGNRLLGGPDLLHLRARDT